jgi:phage-related protein
MAIGFLIGATEVRPDKSLTRSFKPKVHLATFGDGYEQRLADGINTIKEEYSISFETRPKDTIDDITQYFESLKGVTAFNFTIPDSNNSGETTIKVVCSEFDVTYDYGNFYSCNATFRRVYEA